MKLLKRAAAAALSAAILAGSVMSASAMKIPLLGDMDHSGELDVSDMITMKVYIMDNYPSVMKEKLIGDMDGNRVLDVSDMSSLKSRIMAEFVQEYYPSEKISNGVTYVVENVAAEMVVIEGTNGRASQTVYTGALPQQWKAVEKADGYYMMISTYNNRAWTLEDRRGTMWLYARDADINSPANEQLFKFEEQTDGSYLIRPKSNPDAVIQTENDNKDDNGRLLQGGADGSSSEKWSLIKAPETDPAEVLSDGFADKVYTEFMDNFYMTDGKKGYVLKNYNYFWDYAEMLEMLLDTYERSGNPEHMKMFDECYKSFVARFGTDWAWNDFNDDIMWMVIACSRAYTLSGNEMYKEQAKLHFDYVYDRAYDTVFGGGLYWKQGNALTKNSCINSPAVIAATYIYKMYDDSKYADIAAKLFNWEVNTLFEKETGRIFDNIHFTGDGKIEIANWTFTYNQGTFIGAATRLYEMTGDKTYLEYAKKAADYTVYNMYKGDVINNEGGNGEYDDAFGFKGIFMRWLGYYIDSQNDYDYDMWLAKNLYIGWNNRNSYGLVGTRWGTKTSELLVKPFSYYNYVVLAQIAPYERIKAQLKTAESSVLPDIYVSPEQLASEPFSHSPAEPPQFDQSLKKTTISLGGVQYEKGISTNAEGYFEFNIPENAKSFVGVFGVDDCARPGGNSASITCSIYFDGKLSSAYCSGTMRVGDFTNINVPIPDGAKTMFILFGESGDGDSWDNASIGNAGWITK